MDEGRRHGRVDSTRQRADDATVAHLGADALDRLGDERSRRPGRLAVADAEQEVAQDRASARRVHHLRVKLDAIDALAIGERRDRRVAAAGKQVKARRHLADMVAVAHPHRQLAVQAPKQPGGLLDGQQSRPVLARAAGIDLAPEVMGDELHPVADA